MCEIAENCFQVAIIFSAKHPPDSPVRSLDEMLMSTSPKDAFMIMTCTRLCEAVNINPINAMQTSNLSISHMTAKDIKDDTEGLLAVHVSK